MKFLCLAFGAEDGWNSLTDEEKDDVLAQDGVIRDRGDTVVAVSPKITSVRNWDRKLEVTDGAHHNGLPLAGFYVIEGDNVDEIIELVANTPCARARGVIEIHPF